jgi:hypothetical protein
MFLFKRQTHAVAEKRLLKIFSITGHGEKDVLVLSDLKTLH